MEIIYFIICKILQIKKEKLINSCLYYNLINKEMQIILKKINSRSFAGTHIN